MLVPAPTTRFLIGSQPDTRDILVKIRVSVENTSDPTSDPLLVPEREDGIDSAGPAGGKTQTSAALSAQRLSRNSREPFMLSTMKKLRGKFAA